MVTITKLLFVCLLLASSLYGQVLATANGGTGLSSPGPTGNVLQSNGTNWFSAAPSGGPGGGVSNFSAGNLPPLFTTAVATATTTPALSFALSNAAANTIFGNFTGSSSAPSFAAIAACGDATHALSYVAGTGFACQALSGGGGGSALSALTAATVNNTISNAAFTQTWNWVLTGATNGMVFGEGSAGVGTGALVQINGLSNAVTSLDVEGPQNQIHFGATGLQHGGWLFGQNDYAMMIGGARTSGGTALTTQAASVRVNSGAFPGGIDFTGNTGLTPGATFTPNTLETIAPSGAIGLHNFYAGGNLLHQILSGGNNIQLIGNAIYDGTNYIAKTTSPAKIVIGNNGSTLFYGDTGKTIGSAFAPTLIGTIDPTGLYGIASINTPGNTTSGSLTISGLTSKTSLATDSSGNVIAGTAGGPLNPVANISGTYNATAADFSTCAMKYSASGAVTVNLVANTSQPANGQCMIFLNYSTGGTITINRNGQNINGGTGTIIVSAAVNAVQPSTATVWSDGTNYFSTRVSSTVAFAAVTGGTAVSQAFVIGSSSTLGFSGTGAMISPVVNTGVAQGSGLKHQRVASCTTTAAVNGNCAANLTWTTAFADANYTVSCSSFSSPGAAVTIVGKTASVINLVFYNIVGLSGAVTGEIDCIAMHD